ncbi:MULTISPECIES: hypothetical protein [Pseudomonas syringae group]|uniref:hypothetical protein n=1 Tax=Pseudomonas syringae group TaxID=136849 RepID=UPI000F178406|nr:MULTISPECIES: hypothetical protein [Pseudomonas syringae group]QIQ69798.1 hypothetical protein HBB04_00138 [Pseudomonas coronafaciens]RMN23160.1 Non-ribosomal peptide synthetase SyfA [Pseudomonas coronafaciens pv. zizaniae]RMP33121.1 Non-ribosomal peptide synthetase SyfA [Pseudomonas coronafaciens pv. atropurpurea]RMV64659.1 Non-ribosomal peptide synthetase SyfA [Pseudomonas coronafaciens pv. atropurpurea]UQB34448.1 hypothetical protein I9H06_12745 [Pseudomonas tremae]
MQTTREPLVHTLEQNWPLTLNNLSILDAEERRHLLTEFNAAEQHFAQAFSVASSSSASAGTEDAVGVVSCAGWFMPVLL